MDWAALGTALTYGIIGVLTLLAVLLIAFVLLHPKQYDPYRSDLIDEDKQNMTTQIHDIDAGYGHFAKIRDTIKTLKVDHSVQIVVLGDIGRSPRMQYHALSLSQHGARVELIGFNETDIHSGLHDKALVKVIPLTPPPAFLKSDDKFLFVVLAPFKVIWQTLNLLYVLCYATNPAKWMLVQNPPSIPVLALATIVCWLRNTKLIIDWHNFGWSVLALRLGRKHPLVIMSKLFEELFARAAEAHFAVTSAMSAFLKASLDIDVLTLHDRPALIFQPLSPSQRSAFLRSFEMTAVHAAEIENRSWRLLVSSTSWTADEDFGIFLDALVKYSEEAVTNKNLPQILAIITGKGSQKESYIREIDKLNQANKLSRVLVLTGWLSFHDYALLLGAADLGVSLHKSSSGLDLPMKVVDMLGTGLPVVGYSDYETWSELIKEGVNGCGFKTSDDFHALLVQLLGNGRTKLDILRQGALKDGSKRWNQEWDSVAGVNVFQFRHLLQPEGSK